MAGAIALSGQLPNDDEHNGLLALSGHLADAGKDARVLCLVVVDVPKITIVTDTGDRRPIVRLVHIEPIGELLKVSPEWKARLAELKHGRMGDQLPEADDEAEVYATSPDDDPNRKATIKRAGLASVQPIFSGVES